ncbi:MaoC family dehydratase [Ferrovibrio sp.]|uniref:MaoC family dehydratase n=1 Tax=Ferrovibrio sp. TaxID=1917215 RepID=UPI0025B8105B|nr:MaoC family dehydratase [Ferrovibrio sp.]
MMQDWYFDDLLPGQRFSTPGMTVSEAMILDFARVYDPQPFHIDTEAARGTEFGGLIASGFHTLSLSFSLFFRLGVLGRANLGSPGMEELRWLLPLRPGDTIRVEAEVVAAKASQSRPDRGVVTMRHDTFNQHGELILTVNCLHRLKRRPA